jgi:hypothetical protein
VFFGVRILMKSLKVQCQKSAFSTSPYPCTRSGKPFNFKKWSSVKINDLG